MKFFIKPKAPYNFELITSLYARFAVQCVDLYDQGVYQRLLEINHSLHLIKVMSVGSIEKPKLQVAVLPSPKNQKTKKILKEKIAWMTGSDDEVGDFYQIGLKDKKFAPIIKNLYGLRGPKTPTVYEALIIAITEQQIAMSFALKIRQSLVKKYGQSRTFGSQKYFAFPKPGVLAKARPREIKNLKFSLKKAEYIINLSRLVALKKLNLEAMKNWEKEKVLATLTKIRGLGPWTVEYMMCRGMGRYEALPAKDIGLRSSVTRYLGKKERVSEVEVRKVLEKFGPHKGQAAFYLIYAYAFQKYPQEKLL